MMSHHGVKRYESINVVIAVEPFCIIDEVLTDDLNIRVFQQLLKLSPDQAFFSEGVAVGGGSGESPEESDAEFDVGVGDSDDRDESAAACFEVDSKSELGIFQVAPGGFSTGVPSASSFWPFSAFQNSGTPRRDCTVVGLFSPEAESVSNLGEGGGVEGEGTARRRPPGVGTSSIPISAKTLLGLVDEGGGTLEVSDGDLSPAPFA
jgi:hypothetical protein